MFIEGFRPGTIQRYGFDYDAVSEREPQIIYYAISGFGQTGPLASRPAMDPVLQAMTGIVNENRGEHDQHPHRIAISLIDMFTGLLGLPGDRHLAVRAARTASAGGSSRPA